jgi:N-acetylmuramoyl-L-alanine amidase
MPVPFLPSAPARLSVDALASRAAATSVPAGRKPGRPWRVRIAIAIAGITALAVTALLPGGPLSTRVAAADLPLQGAVIALDPGHDGGNATHPAITSRLVFIGTRWKRCNSVGASTASGYPEHRLNFSVARKVKARLEALGATVYLTRSDDTGVGPCIDVRGRLGGNVHADLMVSIHGDGAPSSDRGFFICRPGSVAGWTDDIDGRSLRLAKAIRAGMLATRLPIANYYTETGIRKRTDLGSLNWSDVPAVLVELGNMRNPSDARRMTSPTGRDRYASGLVAGIRRYLGR